MLSLYDEYEQSLIAAYHALCLAEPPTKGEMRRIQRTYGPTNNLRDALAELSRATASYSPAPSDWMKRGTRLPRHRQVVRTRAKAGSLAFPVGQ